ncbi:hypothetical protein HAP47_0012310 [Bradyrhizobium sp. 41S5]|uniref:hypothetical protein n=1 Tax=Bradyrhizobium sp. 41S5 TaxID=1404443 RepID=UPI00156AB43A|nr:hypothetical protein [Bradyrhizobium sp. 41S5]UFX47399.1 hypothetical protein HAP47_0012310 [Bradyrhizobium sp. 41S5]
MLDETGKTIVLVVETDLQLDPAEIDFEPAKVDALCKNLEQHRKDTKYVDVVRLMRRPAPSPVSVETTARFGAATLRFRPK